MIWQNIGGNPGVGYIRIIPRDNRTAEICGNQRRDTASGVGLQQNIRFKACSGKNIINNLPVCGGGREQYKRLILQIFKIEDRKLIPIHLIFCTQRVEPWHQHAHLLGTDFTIVVTRPLILPQCYKSQVDFPTR